MKKQADSIIYSPTDLIRYLASPFASWLDRYHLENPGAIRPDEQTEEEKLLSRTGDEHEQLVLTGYKTSSSGLLEISKGNFASAHAATLAAIKDKAPIIYQAALQRGVFAGFADFLILDGSGKYQHPELFGSQGGDTVFNLTGGAVDYIAELAVQPSDLFYHIVAILHSPAYGAENADALRQDWPRIPLPADRAILLAGSNIGTEIAALLDLDTPVAHVTTGAIRNELRTIGQLQTIDRENQIDLNITARWGYRQRGGVMPGPGRVEWSGAACRVFLNASTFWEAVPQNVWEYTLGGYQVLKKWLSYRERDVLGRALRPNEAMEFTNSVRRIAAILSLGAQLDDHYTSCREATTE